MKKKPQRLSEDNAFEKYETIRYHKKKLKKIVKESRLARKKLNKDSGVQEQNKWKPGSLGIYAVCRFICNGNKNAAILLCWIGWRMRRKNLLIRNGKEWTAASAECWARESGLTPSEYKNHALPYLKKLDVIEVKTWKLRGERATWIRLKKIGDFSLFSQEFIEYERNRATGFKITTLNAGKFVSKTKNKSSRNQYSVSQDFEIDEDL